MATKVNNKRTKSFLKCNENFASFTEIGGLSEHIQTLKELIIFPLLYKNVYTKFKIQPPRGVLFHGPPGTGKTLLAGALAKECSNEINSKVTFFNRKGGDILNKWVGESEEKLRMLFKEAENKQPSIIFFDEIDGLAPVRSSRNDHVHANVVSTLLSLMDGLDKLSGVVVIGATNRIDSLDSALRRPGRFDRELYFPTPAYNARREILEVYVKSWTVRPKQSFLSYLADITVGYSGADLQALCCEAVMSCLRRNYPDIHNAKMKIQMKNLKVTENDFLTARTHITSSTNRDAKPVRRLSTTVQPLLQRQLNKVILELQKMIPHFTDPRFNYHIGSKQYTGRLLLLGNNNQGHNTHLAPAILHALEHLPSYIIDIQTLYESANCTAEEICVQKMTQARMNLPSILLTYRLDEWWNIVEESTRAILISMIKDMHAGLPLLLIVTATNELPSCLTKFFIEPYSIVHLMEDPNEKDRENFFYPLFMETALSKCEKSLLDNSETSILEIEDINSQSKISRPTNKPRKLRRRCKEITVDNAVLNSVKRKCSSSDIESSRKFRKCSEGDMNLKQAPSDNNSNSWSPLFTFAKKIQEKLQNIETQYINKQYSNDDLESPSCSRKTNDLTNKYQVKRSRRTETCDDLIIPGDSQMSNITRIKYLFRRVVTVTSAHMPFRQLELLYDMLATCVNRENQDVPTILENIACILNDFELNIEAIVDY